MTTPGRVVGVVTMVVGIGIFGGFTGYLANAFPSPQKRLPAPAAADTLSELDQIRSELDEHARASTDLQARLREIAASV